MKQITKILIVAAITLFWGMTLQAQEKSGSLHYLGKGDFAISGTHLTEGELYDLLGDEVYYETYLPAQKQRRIGLPVGIAGAGLLGATAVWYAVSIDTDWVEEKTVVISSSIAWTVGFAASAGLAYYIIGNKRLKWIADDYNRRNGSAASLQVGPTLNGIGLVLNF